MDYVVLARKLRPQRFQDLIGQEVTARALRNAVLTNRLAHAYLFAGSRGVGKTSTARILTKAFNCLNPADGEPCNACEHCIEIGNNASPDVLEIDAASNRGIDNIRELRENTKYAPAKCRYKTYIVDEVHMLTQESFNALLKTLEEPPAHVKFILATTHPHRIPDTILSRCQRFDFARISLARMADYLGRATASEGLTFSRAALESIARNSAGGMRDALTMVDQVVAFAGPKPSDEDVLGLLRLLDHGEIRALFEAILAQDLNAALAGFGRIVGRGHELHQVLEALLREVKDLTLYSVLGSDNAYFGDHLPETLAFYEQKKGVATLDQLQQMFHVLLDLDGQLRVSGHARACFEMALVKACRVQPLVGIPELIAEARDLLRSGAGTGGAPKAGRAASGIPTAFTRPPQPPPSPAMPRPARDSAPPRRPDTAEPARQVLPSQPAPLGGSRPERVAPQGAAPPAVARSATTLAPAGGQAATDKAPQTLAGNPDREPDEGDVPEQQAPCDDPRWVALVQGIAAKNRPLWARLTSVDVKEIAGEEVKGLLQGKALDPQDASVLETAGKEAFGAAFRMTWIGATPDSYRSRRSVAGRKRWRAERAEAKERAEAAADPAVQSLRRVFPNSKVVDVQLAGATRTPDDPRQG